MNRTQEIALRRIVLRRIVLRRIVRATNCPRRIVLRRIVLRRIVRSPEERIHYRQASTGAEVQ